MDGILGEVMLHVFHVCYYVHPTAYIYTYMYIHKKTFQTLVPDLFKVHVDYSQ